MAKVSFRMASASRVGIRRTDQHGAEKSSVRPHRGPVDHHAIGTWGPLQPTEAERRIDPRVVATRGDEVVIEYTTRAVSPDGERFESPVLGLYQVRDGKFARAQMFHYDTAAILAFLERAGRRKAVEAA
jgi:ketosteroid isomerase-like protein